MAVLIAMVVGALIGMAGGGAFGVLTGAALGWLLVNVYRQQVQLAALREAVTAIGARRAEPGSLVAPTPSAPAVAAVAVPVAVEPPSFLDHAAAAPAAFSAATPSTSVAAPFVTTADIDRDASRAGPDTVPMAEPSLAAVSRQVAPMPAGGGAAHPPRPDAFAPIRNWFAGGNTIVKAGVLILFIGLAFLAKYATEHTHVPPEVRLAGIGAVAIALLGFGWRLRVSRPGYAQVLQGGAVAVLYLTLFAAFYYFEVLGAPPAFVLMVAVAALAAALAVLQDARALATIGALGGFATPLIVSTGSDNAAALFAYYLVLDAGIAAVAWSKTWRSLNLIGFVATFAVATTWGVLRYRPETFAMSEAYLCAFFLLFVVILLLPARRAMVGTTAAPADRWVNSSLLFGLPTIVFALQYGLVRDTPYGTALSALVLAGFYVLLASWMRRRPQLGITFEATLAVATIFLTLVIPFALDQRSTAGAWTLEGAGLVWIGFRQGRSLPRAFGYFLHAIAGVAMLLGHERFGAPGGVFNAYLFNGLMAAAAAIASAYFVHRHLRDDRQAHGEDAAQPLLIALATLWLVVTAGLEIDSFVDERFFLAAGLVAASAVALLYVVLGSRFDWRAITFPAVAHAPLLFLFAAVDGVVLAEPLADGGTWAWPLAFLVHAAVLRLAAPNWPAVVARSAHAIGVLALALLGALIGRSITAGWGDADSAWPWLGWLAVPALLLFVLPRPATAAKWPVSAAPAAYARHACAVLAVALLFWTLVANIASDGSADPLPHVPLLNPLDLGVALALVAVLLWLRAVDAVKGAPIAALALAGFVWLNAMLVRGFHHYGGVPYRFDAWVDSLAVETGITLLWTTTALVSMWIAARRGARLPWVAGAVLLGAVVVKLLIVDLSGAGTVARIVSFIGVGVLMLVIGYVAPLPTREVRHASV